MKTLLVLILTVTSTFARDRYFNSNQFVSDYINDYYNPCQPPVIIIEVNIPERDNSNY